MKCQAIALYHNIYQVFDFNKIRIIQAENNNPFPELHALFIKSLSYLTSNNKKKYGIYNNTYMIL